MRLELNSRRVVDSEWESGVKLQLPPVTPVAFTVDQGIFEGQEQGMTTLEEDSYV